MLIAPLISPAPLRADACRVDRAGPAVRLGATPIAETPEGYKVYEGVAAYGDVVYEYPEYGRNEYVPAREALSPEAVASLVGVPFTIHHPDDLLSADDPDGVKEHVEGTVRAARADLTKSPPELKVEVVVWTRPAQEDIESGAVVELSPGYRCEEDPAPAGAVGPGGKPYHLIQRRRRYNHLSGVMLARGVTPDGRRARLDEAAPYARGDAPQETDSMLTQTTADAPMMIAPAADMDPAEAMAMFSPEAAEILKSLPPEDLAKLQALALGAKAEAAEESVIAEGVEQAAAAVAAAPAEVEAEADAPKVEIEVEAAEGGEGEGEEEAGEGAANEPAAADATAPMAADMSKAMKDMYDMMAAMKADMEAMKAGAMKPKADAPPPSPPAAKPKADAAKVDAAAIRAEVEAKVREEVAFVEAVKARGVRCDSLDSATATAVATVKEHAATLAPLAEAAAAAGKRADLLALLGHVDALRETARRDALVGDQFAAIRGVVDAEDDYRQTRDEAGLPAYIDLSQARQPAQGGK